MKLAFAAILILTELGVGVLLFMPLAPVHEVRRSYFTFHSMFAAVCFALAGIINRFRYLRLSLALLLALIGTKFILKDILPAEPDTVYYALGAVTVILTVMLWLHL